MNNKYVLGCLPFWCNYFFQKDGQEVGLALCEYLKSFLEL